MRTRLRPAGFLLVLGCALLLAVGGCGDEDPAPLEPEPEPGPPPAGSLLSYFRTAYEEMDLATLDWLLADDFQMILLPDTQDQWGWDSDYDFDRATFLELHGNLFGGDPGLDADGNTIHPIASIGFDLLEQLLGWTGIPADDENFGGTEGEVAPFRVTIQFHDANLTHRYLVQEQVNFYIKPVTIGGQSGYHLLGLRGVTGKTAATTWDEICAMYLHSAESITF